MPDNGLSPSVSDRDLDEVVRILDGAAIVVHDFEGIISRWTSGCEQLYGWTRGEVVGRVVHELLATAFPQPLDSIREQVRASGGWHGELTHRHKDGHAIHVASRWTSPAGRDSPRSAIVETNNDITDLRTAPQDLVEREAQLRSVLETVPDAMIVIDERGIVTSLSTAAEHLFGYRSVDVVGRNVKMLIPEPGRQSHDHHLARFLATGESRIIGVHRIVTGQRKDGSIFPMEISIGEATVDGRAIFTSFIRDLTSRQRMEAELRQAQKMEAVGQLTGGLAHDFNNLLTVIIGNLEMLEPRLTEQKQRLLLDEARAAADNGATLTRQLLAFGRRQPLNPQPMDIGPLVTGFSELMRRSLGESIELLTVITGASHRVLVDAPQFQNALLNLALNARDAMPQGGRLAIEISRVRVDDDREFGRIDSKVPSGEYVLIVVRDTGNGMTADVQMRAVEPFFTTKQSGSGTGLGLAMVYGFVKQSGGYLQIQSEVGKGTIVRLFLPAMSAALASDAVEAASTTDRPARASGECILVVEDDSRVRRVSVARLESAGYTVLEAASSAEALALFATHPEIRLVFTDVVMPGGMSGDELAREIRSRRPGAVILFTSGYAEPAVASREQAIAPNWLSKPYTARDLIATVRNLLGQQS
jgi:PAS domain S-box-containing protein